MSTDRDLVITRDIPVLRDKLYRCWTEPELIRQGFAPKPWAVTQAETDVRAGGASLVVMRGPDGQEFPNPGLYLEVVSNERIVATDEDLGDGKTRYTARARHWTAADREMHEQMGFHEGWGVATTQLAELAATL